MRMVHKRQKLVNLHSHEEGTKEACKAAALTLNANKADSVRVSRLPPSGS